jgi:uncharacterized membrane protein YeiB
VADPCVAAAGPLVVPPPAGAALKTRFQGVDIVRGVALIGMLAANVGDDVLTADGQPSINVLTVTGRSATLFVMVAGISLAFISGGRRPVQGLARRAARTNIAVRAVLIGAIGLALAYVAEPGLGVILTYYLAFFLLAIPLIGLRPRTLVAIAGGLVAAGPLLLLAAEHWDLEAAFQPDPTLTAPFTDPIGLVLQFLLTGDYPAVTYMAYICLGLAIGRLDLTSTKVARQLLAGGLALAVAAWVTSSVLVFHLGGLQQLLAASDPGTTANQIVWNADVEESWWWLALRVHHSGTTLDMLHTIGVAAAVIGAVLLVCRLRIAQRLLRPVALAGSMTLTVYCAHAPVVAWFEARGLLEGHSLELWLGLVAGAVAFAVLWHRWRGQGPLERLVAIPADRARRAVLAAPAGAGPGPGRESEPSGRARSTATAP